MPTRSLQIAGATVEIFPTAEAACTEAAKLIAHAIRESKKSRNRAVLGLATGNTPVPVYKRLVALHKEEELSFNGISTYNLDEYYPISPADSHSYRAYMDAHLFRHVDITPNRTHVLDGSVPEPFVNEHAAQFDRWIVAEGGLDLQLLGIGRNGHIGFNEPMQLPVAEAVALPTRVVELHPITLADAALDFEDPKDVPTRALTLGLATILAARSILVLAFGPRKAEIVAKALRGPITPEIPASLLRTTPEDRVIWMLDDAAAAGLDIGSPASAGASTTL